MTDWDLGQQTRNLVDSRHRLLLFLSSVVPNEIPDGDGTQSKEQFLEDVYYGVKASTMSLRITQVTHLDTRSLVSIATLTSCPSPYLLSHIDWQDPGNDPIFRQFIPRKSLLLPDHPKVDMDSLGEKKDSPVEGLVHRYPDKALFLGQLMNLHFIFHTQS